jgi:hypothetical protein
MFEAKHMPGLLVVLCVTRLASADDEVHVLPCRPTLACTADLAAPGALEVELGYQLHHAGGASTHSIPVLVKLPLAHWIEVWLGSNGPTYTDADHRFVDDVYAGAKLHLVDQTAHRPSLAVTITPSVPLPAQRGYSRGYDLFATGHASKDLGKLHADFVLGLFAWQLDTDARYQPWSALAATYAATPTLGVFVEPHYFADASPAATRDIGVMVGAAYAARATIQLDIAVNATLLDPTGLAVLAGISIIPARL